MSVFRLSLVPALIALTACALPPAPAQADPDAAFMDELQDPLDLSTPEEAVRSAFRAMYLGDGAMLDEIFLEDAALRRVTQNGEIRANGLTRWRDWVDEQETGAAYENIFALEVEQYGPLATVWAPFVVHYKGEIAGCGVNQFTLAETEGAWHIVFGMDTGKQENCETFKDDYRPASGK